ncbi:hypothetical protein BG006_001158 [Podila minutissima]|uniref:IMD domain-containing protein n=1 Tax=Podila minutissima TaxID=64525 RepID=A0A9P5SD48_9FUNG|nr:hypothetical protein BG006_001158 [Podila minutissima]
MISTVSLIDPTTLNPSFSESSRIGRPAVIVTRGDQQAAVDQFQQLLSNAKAYRLQMLALSKAAANFGYSLEKIAHSKTAIMDPSNVGSSLQAAAGLHYLMSNHHQILSDTVYKQFEIPLLQHLDTHKANIEASEAQYERSMRDMSQKIRETEAASLQNGRKRQRDLLQFRQALTTLTMQVDELERIKLGYYFSNLESEQANLQLILQKTSTIVRAEVDIYERIANKGLNDLILEPMTTQGPDPYCTYPTTDEFSSIFSILPPTPIIPTSGPGAATTNTTTPQPDGMSNFYGYHEANPFSTARTQATAANRHLFGEASSVESKESMMNKATILTTAAAAAAVVMTATKDKSVSNQSNSSSSSTDVDHDTATEHGSSLQRAESPEHVVQGLSIQESMASKEGDKSTTGKDMDYFNNMNQSHEPSTEESPPSSATQGVNLRNGQQHYRSHPSKHIDDSPGPASSPSEPSSSVPSYSLHRSRSGSRSHLMLASTPESPPVRTGIHIGQDSELLNNRDFSFSYEPTELLGHRSHVHHSHSRDFHGFDEMEEDDEVMGGFRSASPKPVLRQEPEQEQTEEGTQRLEETEQKPPQPQQPSIHELRHQSSQGQLSRGSSTNLSILGSSTSGSSGNGSPCQSGIISGIATSILRSSGRIRSSASSSLGHSPEGSVDGQNFDGESSSFFEQSSSTKQQTLEDMADHIRELGRGFDEGIPAFTEDEMDIAPVRRTSQERERGAFMIGALENSGFGQESNSSEDLRQLDGAGSGRGSRAASVISKKTSTESIRMADGSCKDI